MSFFNWQLQKPIDAILFDCDGTLSQLEGVNELAKLSGVEEEVSALTMQAMAKTGLNPALYQERLSLIRPHYEAVKALGKHYFDQRVPDTLELIRIFKRLKKSVYLISAGVNPAVDIFGVLMEIPKNNIFAVDLCFDAQGKFQDFDHQSPLIWNQGKGKIIKQIKLLHTEIVYVGDGMNDLIAKPLVRRFVGYGGVFYRENIANAADFYIQSLSMSSLLPLVLTSAESKQLFAAEKILYEKGLVNLGPLTQS